MKKEMPPGAPTNWLVVFFQQEPAAD